MTKEQIWINLYLCHLKQLTTVGSPNQGGQQNWLTDRCLIQPLVCLFKSVQYNIILVHIVKAVVKLLYALIYNQKKKKTRDETQVVS